MFKFDIKNRFTGDVMFTAELEKGTCITSLNMGFAVQWGVKNGADLRGAYLRGADLEGADLRGAYLRGADLRGAYLRGADLEGADLRGAYLRGASLEGANLRGADLEDANIEGADLIGAYLEVPVIENIHQAVYEAVSKPGALDMSDWHHPCGTAHCRGGTVVALAGEAGAKLERQIGTAAAAYHIYRKSDPDTAFAINFFDTNEGALSEMKRLAEQEAAKQAAECSQ